MSLDIQLETSAKPLTKRNRFIRRLFRRAGREAFILGEDFEVTYKVTNIDTRRFPGGVLEVDILWPNEQGEKSPYQISSLNPGEHYEITARWGILATGFSLFHVRLHQGATLVRTTHGYGIQMTGAATVFSNLFRDVNKQNKIVAGVSFFSVFGQSAEEFYELWGMIISAIGLFILVILDVIPKIIAVIHKMLN